MQAKSIQYISSYIGNLCSHWRRLGHFYTASNFMDVFPLVVQCFLGVYTLSVQSNGVLYGLLVMSVTGHGIFIVLYEYIHYRLSELVTQL